MEKEYLPHTKDKIAAAEVTSWAFRKYQRERKEVLKKLVEGSRLVDTPCGRIEVATAGDGPAVLLIHGAAGGYDQGLLHGYSLPEAGFKVISISRPGYLRTPLETGRTPEEQADVYAALLDEIGIEKAALFGISAGGMSSVQFNLRHPHRCWGLILVSAVTAALPQRSTSLTHLAPLISTSDFIPWLFMKPTTVYILRPKVRAQIKGDPKKVALLEELVQSVYPTSLRIPGALNDGEQIKNLPDLPLDEIKAPTLVIHGENDSLVPFEIGERSAKQIPNADFLPIPKGTHYCILTHLEQTHPAILKFLKKNAPIS